MPQSVGLGTEERWRCTLWIYVSFVGAAECKYGGLFNLWHCYSLVSALLSSGSRDWVWVYHLKANTRAVLFLFSLLSKAMLLYIQLQRRGIKPLQSVFLFFPYGI